MMIAITVAEKDIETSIAIAPITVSILRTDPEMSMETEDIGLDIMAAIVGADRF